MKNQNCHSCDPQIFKRDGNCGIQKALDGLVAKCAGPWAETKQNIIRDYSHMITVGMKNNFKYIIYADLYAGSGVYFNRETGYQANGSALNALQHNYHKAFLNDLSGVNVDALHARTVQYGEKVVITAKDANTVAREINLQIPMDSLTFCLLDPDNFGDLKFEAIEHISRGKRSMDLLINFPYCDYKRSVHLSKDRFDEFFGTTEWQKLEASYSGKGGGSRADALIKLYMKQLNKLGYLIPEKRNSIRIQNTNEGIIYYLVYASKHKKGYEFCAKMEKYAISQQSLDI